MAERNHQVSRRGFLLLGASGVVAASLAGAWRRWRTIGTLGHEPGVPGDAPVSVEIRATLTAFLGAAFGVRLSTADEQDLDARLAYATEHDGSWPLEYRWLSDYVNLLAIESGFDSFSSLAPSRCEEIVRATLQSGVDSRTQRIRAFFHIDGRELLRMRKSTIPHLFRLYRMSGVPWRQRGYTSWPGMADERLAYTRAMPERRC